MRLLRFKGPRPKLPEGLGKAEELVARFSDAKARKLEAESTIRDCYLYAVPHRETFTQNMTEGQKRNAHIFDSTAVLGVPKWAGRVQSRIMPPWREYTRLIPGPEIPREVAEDSRVQVGLKQATETYFSHLNHSNFNMQVHESLQDLAVGTGALNFWRGPLGGKLFRFDACPMAELCLEEGPMSTIESTWREINICVGHIGRIYPGAQLQRQDAELVKNGKLQQKVKKIEGVLFDPATERTFGVLIDMSDDKPTIIWQTFWRTSPRIVFRWSVTPGELYGRGPIYHVLSDIKTANKVVEFILRHAALQVAGVYTSTSDTAVNPYSIRIAPGVVIPVDSNSSRNPTIRALERSGDIGLAFEVLDLVRKPIKDALFEQEFRPDGPVRSATEIVIEDRKLAEDNSSVLGRQQTELVEPVTARGVSILAENGSIPPIRVDGRSITLKHQSPQARAQDMDEIIQLQFGMEVLAPLGQELVGIGLRVEDLSAWVAKKMGWDPELIRPKAERAKLQQDAAKLLADTRGQQQAA